MIMEAANQDKEEEKGTFKENRPEVEKDLVTWTAPARPFKRRDKQFYLTTISIVGLVSLIIFLAEGAMPVILIISLVFLYYVMSTVPPENIEYKITNKGVKVAGKRTDWENFGRFWFSKRHDSELLIFETFQVPGRMELVIDSNFKEQIKKTLSEYLTEEEISPSTLDKAVDWFSKKLPN
jgi:hypothetical protein